MSVGVSQLAVVASIGGDKSSNPVIAPGIGLGLGVTLSKVVVTSKGGVWAVETSVGETVAQIGIGLGLSITLSKVVVTAKGGVWAVETSVGETVAQIGIGLGLSITLSKVVVTSKGGVWAVDTAVGVWETVAHIGIGLGLGITLSKVVNTTNVVWAVHTSIGVGETVAHIGIGLGLSLALSKVKSRVDNRVDSLGSQVGGGSDLLGWGVVWGHGTIGMSDKSVSGVDSGGSHNGGNMVDSSNTGVKERRVSLSISCGSKGQSSNKSFH